MAEFGWVRQAAGCFDPDAALGKSWSLFPVWRLGWVGGRHFFEVNVPAWDGMLGPQARGDLGIAQLKANVDWLRLVVLQMEVFVAVDHGGIGAQRGIARFVDVEVLGVGMAFSDLEAGLEPQSVEQCRRVGRGHCQWRS